MQENAIYRVWTRLMSWFWPWLRRRKKNIFSVSRIFPGKVYSIIQLGFECTINPQNLFKIVGVIFQKIEILIFLLCELPLILVVGENWKYGSRYLREDPRYRFWTRSIDWCRLYVRRLSDRQTDRQTGRHTHTHTYRHFSSNTFLECGSDVESKTIKKIEVEFFDDCNTSFIPNVARR